MKQLYSITVPEGIELPPGEICFAMKMVDVAVPFKLTPVSPPSPPSAGLRNALEDCVNLASKIAMAAFVNSSEGNGARDSVKDLAAQITNTANEALAAHGGAESQHDDRWLPIASDTMEWLEKRFWTQESGWTSDKAGELADRWNALIEGKAPPPQAAGAVFTSCAEWPKDAGLYCQNPTKDTHATWKAADAVCRRLMRDGFGGDGEIFPVRTWVEGPRPEAQIEARPTPPEPPVVPDGKCVRCNNRRWVIAYDLSEKPCKQCNPEGSLPLKRCPIPSESPPAQGACKHGVPMSRYCEDCGHALPDQQPPPVTATGAEEARYVVGFMFSEDRSRVALIRKNKPAWQRGLLNGIGGKIEPGESPADAMAREFQEEAGIASSGWVHFLRMHGKDDQLWSVECFATTGDLDALRSVESEKVEIVAVRAIQDCQTIENLPWMIPLALDCLEDERPLFVDAAYTPMALAWARGKVDGWIPLEAGEIIPEETAWFKLNGADVVMFKGGFVGVPFDARIHGLVFKQSRAALEQREGAGS